jgi:hypothetical protein
VVSVVRSQKGAESSFNINLLPNSVPFSNALRMRFGSPD